MIDPGRVFVLIMTLVLASGPPIASQGPPAPTIVGVVWDNKGPQARTTAVSVKGLSTEIVKALETTQRSPEQWAEIFAVRLDSQDPQALDRPAIIGSYRLEGDSLRFTPRFPLDLGRTYVARYRPSKVPGGSGTDHVWHHLVRKPDRPATVVTRVTPSGDRVPENLLKFYLTFSSPMSRGEVYDRVRLIKPDGQAVDSPFLRLGEELWDPTGTRLTLLIDPGRIKQGLKPREEFGPVLEAGKTYTLVIDAGWLDAEGNPLGRDYRKQFRAEAADEVQPDLKRWVISHPRVETLDPLEVQFPEPLDRALLESALEVVDAQARPVAGKLAIDRDETRWRFTPASPWSRGPYTLEVDNELEDLAGNSLRRPFEVDVQRDTPVRPEVKLLRLPIPVQPPSP